LRPLIAAALLLGGPAGAASIVDPGFGPFGFTAGPWELSGIARTAGDQYYAVGDTGGLLVPLAIEVAAATGAVTGVTPGVPVVLAGGVDLEGVAWDAGTSTVLVSDEVGPALRRHDPVSGALLGTVAVPPIFSSARPNRSLEALSRDAASGVLWTANEDALVPDGAATTFATGGVVRLQRFDATGAADAQWAYQADPIPGAPLSGLETSGVVELLALPSGELLVMERSLSSLLFSLRIYQVDFAGATDTAALASLTSGSYTPVGKTLLWSAQGGFSNFEGMALGPSLDDGSTSLLLIADDNGTQSQALYPLRVTFVPEPGTAALVAAALLGLAMQRRIGVAPAPSASSDSVAGRTARRAPIGPVDRHVIGT
jgi:hypothetical protein